MPMQDEQRRAYLERAGVTQEQIDQTVGELPIHEGSYQARGLSRDQAHRVREAVRQVVADAAIIAAKYSTIAKRADGDVGREVAADELATDRRHLDELFADEYTLHNPFGQDEGKEHVIDAMLKGMISYDGMGSQGFEASSQSLQVHGDSAVAIGDYRMRATGRAKDAESGEVYQQDLGGTYRITNTYVHRDGRWQAATSQMTAIPAEHKFVLTPDS
ncbi:hypothetical protein GCM10023322_07900 [Rugosimonospora acidiphila]|uniref:DUF4440 domain-containing protein n=1 Tax=Rugosimonospora acidiphila TaxID=556531 RepID=A0ABP9RJQ3_9ACTN